MADLLNFADTVVLDGNGDPVSGAKATFFETGTNTPVSVYTTEAADVAHPSPLVSDAEGVFPAVFYTGTPNVKAIITDAADVTLPGYPKDPVSKVSTTSSGAGQTSFAPTTRIPENNVQDAIVAVDAKIGSPTAAGTALVEAADVVAQKALLAYGDLADKSSSTNADWTQDPESFSNRQDTEARIDTKIAAAPNPAAFVRFNGVGTPAIEAQLNVTSITDLGAGQYRVNFTTALSTANPVVSINYLTSGGGVNPYYVRNIATTSANVSFDLVQNGNLTDSSQIHVLVFEE